MLPPSLPKPAKAGVRKSSHEFMFVDAYLSTELVPHPNDLAVAASLSQQSLNASRAHSAKDMVSEEYWSSDGAWGAGRGHFPSVANLIVLCWPVEVLCSSFLFRLVAGAWREWEQEAAGSLTMMLQPRGRGTVSLIFQVRT